MRTLSLAAMLLLGLTACSPDWLRQYTVTDIEVDNIHVAVSWLLIDDGQRDVYDIHVSRTHNPAGMPGQAKLPATTARAAAERVMADRPCKSPELYGDTVLPQVTYSFRAICSR